MYSMHACTHFASGIPALLAEELPCTKTREDVKKIRHQHVVQYDHIHIPVKHSSDWFSRVF